MSAMCSSTPPTGPELCEWLGEVSVRCHCDVTDDPPLPGQILQWNGEEHVYVDIAAAQVDCSLMAGCTFQDLGNVANAEPNEGNVYVVVNGNLVPRDLSGFVCATIRDDCDLDLTVDLCDELQQVETVPGFSECTGGLIQREIVTTSCDSIPWCVVQADAVGQEWDANNPNWIDPATVPEFCEMRLCNGHTGSELWTVLNDTQGVPQWHQKA